MKYLIKDWASNILFNNKIFNDFESAEAFLCDFFDTHKLKYEEERGEYYIEEEEL